MNYLAASGPGYQIGIFIFFAASSGVPACGRQVKLIYPDIPKFGTIGISST